MHHGRLRERLMTIRLAMAAGARAEALASDEPGWPSAQAPTGMTYFLDGVSKATFLTIALTYLRIEAI